MMQSDSGLVVFFVKPKFRSSNHETEHDGRRQFSRWIEVLLVTPIDDESLTRLHAGERDAISLALTVHADVALMDERRGRQQAKTVA